MAGDTAPERVAHNMRDLPIDAITRQLNDRFTNGSKMSGGARDANMDFNAKLVTALREQGLWPTRPVQKSSSFQ